MKDRLLSLDPGNNTGYALFINSCCTEFYGTIRCPKKIKELENIEQIFYMSKKLNGILRQYKPLTCYIEGVTVWADSLKSITSAVRGNLIKLAYLIGSYSHTCELNGVAVRIVTPQEWKGQMSKEVVAKRVYRAVHLTFPNDHITDAVGIGLYALGQL